MKIVIVGGGTAGWMAACYFARYNHSSENVNEIVVIESSKIPIIGAGEGSTGLLTKVVDKEFKKWGINEKDFLYNTASTLKLGIRFKDWNGVGTEFISPVQPSESAMGSIDTHLLTSHVKGNYYDSSPSGFLMEENQSTYSKSGDTVLGHSYHFDAHKVGKYFKEKCMEHGVKNIVGEINQLNIDNETGFLKSVNIKESTEKIEADFWVDASGFSKVLIGNMDGGWESYKEVLPTNAAIPYLYNHKKDENVLAETLAWAQPNGWMWQIPTQERYGCGYVYSDNHTTYDKALEELIKNTGRDIEPIRNLKFEAGRVKKFWSKNVLAVGLSCGFLEPLQATSIHSTLIQLDLFAYHYFNSDLDKIDFKTSTSPSTTGILLIADIESLLTLISGFRMSTLFLLSTITTSLSN